MQCRYINLDHAIQRKTAIEASFRQAARPGWTLERFKAIDSALVEAQSIPGAASTVAKACYLSHKMLIDAHAGSAGHLLVLEDDAELGIATCEIVDGFLQQNSDADWDLLYLDICVGSIDDMLTLYFHRQQLIRTRQVVPLDLAKMSFYGSTAYVVNARSIAKLATCLDAGLPIDDPHDIYLSKRIRAGELKAAVLFPFVTTLSQHAASSQIQPPSVDTLNHARNVFRNLIWLESAPEKIASDLARFEEMIAASQYKAFSTILTMLLPGSLEAGAAANPAPGAIGS